MKLKLLLITAAALCLLLGCEDTNTSQSPAQDSRSDTSATTTAAADDSSVSQAETCAETTSAAETTTTQKPQPPREFIFKGMDTVEVYSQLTADEFVTEKNVQLKNGSAKMPTSKTGTFEVDIPYIYDGNVFSQKLSYTVVDTTAPTVFYGGYGCYHTLGKKFDLNDYVSFADNYDREPTLTYSGKVDIDKQGAYPITATVSDHSGNSVSWDITVNVGKNPPSGSDGKPTIQFSDFIKRDYGSNVRFGIDVSFWQGDIDFKAVKNAGCEFVMIRIGSYFDSVSLDKCFKANLDNALAAGLDVGVYFYTTDTTPQGAREHARWIAKQLDGKKLAMPVAFDWEEFDNFQQYKMNIHDLNEVYAAFADEIKKCGYTAMLYSSPVFLNKLWSEQNQAANPVWLAHYVDKTDFEGNYGIWQIRDYGRIPGISGIVDLNVQYMDKKFV